MIKTENENKIEVLKGEVLTLEVEQIEKQKRLARRNANLIPIKKYSDCTPEEIAKQKEIVKKGGIARAKQFEKQKNLKETTLILLKSKVTKELAKKYIDTDTLATLDIDNLTMQDILTARMLQEVLENGNSKAYEIIRDTSGQKPTTEIDLQADIVTAADRELLANINDRLVNLPNKKAL